METILDALSDGTFETPVLAASPQDHVRKLESAVREIVDQCAYWTITDRDVCRRLMNRVVLKLQEHGIRILPWYACMQKLKAEGNAPARFVLPDLQPVPPKDAIRDFDSVLRLYEDQLEPYREIIERIDKLMPESFGDGIAFLEAIDNPPPAITEVIESMKNHLGPRAEPIH